jgi:hypothetical protein
VQCLPLCMAASSCMLIADTVMVATYRDRRADDCSCEDPLAALTMFAECAAGAFQLFVWVNACNLGWRRQQQGPLHHAGDLDSVHGVLCVQNARAETDGLHAVKAASGSRAEPAAGCHRIELELLALPVSDHCIHQCFPVSRSATTFSIGAWCPLAHASCVRWNL